MWWSLLALGCGSADTVGVSPADRAAYLAAADDPGRCKVIEDVDLRRECTVMAAGELAQSGDRAAAEALCAPLEDDTWRAECGFLVIDQADLLGEQAVEACLALPTFVVTCRSHAYDRHLLYHLPITEGEEQDWRRRADALIDVYLTPRAPEERERRVDDKLLVLVAKRMDGVFDAGRCGELSVDVCAGVYAQMLEFTPGQPIDALCAPPMSVETVVAAGGKPWKPNSKTVAHAGLRHICEGPTDVPRKMGAGMLRPGRPPEHERRFPSRPPR